MNKFIDDFSLFVKEEFDLDVKSNELKKIIGNNAVMFKTFQIIMNKFKSKHNGEIIRKQLELDAKQSKLNQLVDELKKGQNNLAELIKTIKERKAKLNESNKLKEYYEFKQFRIKQLIKLIDQIIKSNGHEIDTLNNLNKIDKNINLLDLNLNLDEIDDKYPLPPQINYSLVEKQIDECIKEINGSIFEISELMKNEDFSLDLGDDFIENLTKTDYKIDIKQPNEVVEIRNKDKRQMKLNKNYENHMQRTNNLYNKHKNKVFDLVKKVEEHTSSSSTKN